MAATVIPMDCDRIREALSARLDGEDPPLGFDPSTVTGHLNACAACRSWLKGVEDLGRAVRISGAVPVPVMDAETAGDLLRGLPESPSRGRQRTLRTGLVAVAALQMSVVVPPLFFGHDREAPVHVAHEMGSFCLAIAIGLLAAAHRPQRAAGLFTLVATAGAALLVTAIIDLARGATTIADESPHLLVVAGALLLWALSRTVDPRRAPVESAVGAGPPMLAAAGPDGAGGAGPRLRLVRRPGTEGRRHRRVA